MSFYGSMEYFHKYGIEDSYVLYLKSLIMSIMNMSELFTTRNLIVIGAVIIVVVALLVRTGRHRVKINGILEIETNIPESTKDGSDVAKNSPEQGKVQ